MAKYSIDSSTLTDIADAIRGKYGETDKIAVTDFAEAILGISGGGDLVAETGDFTFSENLQDEVYVEHSLEKVPQYIIVWIEEKVQTTPNGALSLALYKNNGSHLVSYAQSSSARLKAFIGWFGEITDESFTLNSKSEHIWANNTYKWLAIGGIE